MFLIQILLPLRDNEENALPREYFGELRTTLTGKFGGLTAYTRAPAQGIWDPDDRPGEQRDDVVIYEVMTDELERDWWDDLRRKLEALFDQEVVVVRAMNIERL
jgi:hypothetical protein